jgi:phosphoribosylaminoimidazole carboxylase (NCAIR synthetase)
MLLQVQGLAVKYERADAAAKLEAEVAVEEAQAQLHAARLAQQQLDMREQQTEARLAAAADALTAATAEIEQLSMQLLQAQQDLQQQREQRQQQQHNEVGELLWECALSPIATC